MMDPIIVPEPAPEPPLHRQEDNIKPPLDDVDDVDWLAEDDPRRMTEEPR